MARRKLDLASLNREASRIGRQYFYGMGRRRRSYRKAFPYLLQAARAGYVHSQNLVGCCYADGLGVKRDMGTALYWFRAAAAGNHKEALFNAGLAYDYGLGTKKSPRKAFTYYRRAARLGDVASQCNLGVAYLDGLGTTPSRREALRWLRKAALQGDSRARHNLRLLHLRSDGPKRRHAARPTLRRVRRDQ